jgi:hypothetical protein
MRLGTDFRSRLGSALLFVAAFAGAASPASALNGPAPLTAAEPEPLSAQDLRDDASLVVIATVTEVWTTKHGRDTIGKADIRIHKVEQSPKDRRQAADDRRKAREQAKQKAAEKSKTPSLKDDKLKERTKEEEAQSEAEKQKAAEREKLEKALEQSRMTEQDKLKTGDTISITWTIREPRPGDTGGLGHNAGFIRPGYTVLVHVDGKNQVIEPNGISIAEPIFATAEALKGKELSVLRDAAAKATAIGAHDEASKLWRRVVELHDTPNTPEHRFWLAASLMECRLFVEAAQTLMPIATATDDKTQYHKDRRKARRIALNCYWACGDNKEYVKACVAIAKAENAAPEWKAALKAAQELKQSDMVKTCEEALKAFDEMKAK